MDNRQLSVSADRLLVSFVPWIFPPLRSICFDYFISLEGWHLLNFVLSNINNPPEYHLFFVQCVSVSRYVRMMRTVHFSKKQITVILTAPYVLPEVFFAPQLRILSPNPLVTRVRLNSLAIERHYTEGVILVIVQVIVMLFYSIKRLHSIITFTAGPYP